MIGLEDFITDNYSKIGKEEEIIIWVGGWGIIIYFYFSKKQRKSINSKFLRAMSQLCCTNHEDVNLVLNGL